MNLRAYPKLRSAALWGAARYWRFRERYLQDYLFIHINKTGGRSIETALGCLYEHKTARQKRDEVGAAVWADKFTFAFVRNPWDRAVSQYVYRRKTQQDSLAEQELPFEAWVRRVFGEQDARYRSNPVLFLPQADWVTDAHGDLMVDFVGRFERFEDDFQHVCSQLGIDETLPHTNKSSRGDYRSYYTAETAAIVGRYFADDVARFGYTFDPDDGQNDASGDRDHHADA